MKLLENIKDIHEPMIGAGIENWVLGDECMCTVKKYMWNSQHELYVSGNPNDAIHYMGIDYHTIGTLEDLKNVITEEQEIYHIDSYGVLIDGLYFVRDGDDIYWISTTDLYGYGSRVTIDRQIKKLINNGASMRQALDVVNL